MTYEVVVDVNFRHMDGDERYRFGEFDDADAEIAIGHCRRIVDEYLTSAYKSGMPAHHRWASYRMFGEALGRCLPSVKDAKDLMELYTIYGDEVPMIYGEPRINFNAYDYARVKAVSMFAEKFGASRYLGSLEAGATG